MIVLFQSCLRYSRNCLRYAKLAGNQIIHYHVGKKKNYKLPSTKKYNSWYNSIYNLLNISNYWEYTGSEFLIITWNSNIQYRIIQPLTEIICSNSLHIKSVYINLNFPLKSVFKETFRKMLFFKIIFLSTLFLKQVF